MQTVLIMPGIELSTSIYRVKYSFKNRNMKFWSYID